MKNTNEIMKRVGRKLKYKNKRTYCCVGTEDVPYERTGWGQKLYHTNERTNEQTGWGQKMYHTNERTNEQTGWGQNL